VILPVEFDVKLLSLRGLYNGDIILRERRNPDSEKHGAFHRRERF
jgi:hypothetical protein